MLVLQRFANAGKSFVNPERSYFHCVQSIRIDAYSGGDQNKAFLQKRMRVLDMALPSASKMGAAENAVPLVSLVKKDTPADHKGGPIERVSITVKTGSDVLDVIKAALYVRRLFSVYSVAVLNQHGAYIQSVYQHDEPGKVFDRFIERRGLSERGLRGTPEDLTYRGISLDKNWKPSDGYRTASQRLQDAALRSQAEDQRRQARADKVRSLARNLMAGRLSTLRS